MPWLERISLLVLLAAAPVACASTGPYVWVDQWRDRADGPGPGEVVLAAGDTIAIRVYQQDALGTRGKVRPDGRVAVPLVGDVEIAGRHPSEVARDLEAKLQKFVVAPSVTVNLEASHPATVSVVGEVVRGGVFPLEASAGVLDALAAAGGLAEDADRDRIFVVRREPAIERIRFTYARLTQGSGPAVRFRLRAGDVVVVE